MPNSANAAYVRVHILHDPLWVVAQFGNKETGLIYSINGPDQVHVSDDDYIGRELGAGRGSGGDNPYKPLMPLVGRRFRAENWGWPLPADAVPRLIAEVVYKPGAGSQLMGRSVCFEHED